MCIKYRRQSRPRRLDSFQSLEKKPAPPPPTPPPTSRARLAHARRLAWGPQKPCTKMYTLSPRHRGSGRPGPSSQLPASQFASSSQRPHAPACSAPHFPQQAPPEGACSAPQGSLSSRREPPHGGRLLTEGRLAAPQQAPHSFRSPMNASASSSPCAHPAPIPQLYNNIYSELCYVILYHATKESADQRRGELHMLYHIMSYTTQCNGSADRSARRRVHIIL